MKDLRKFIATTIREYLKENISTQTYYHITPEVNVRSIKTNGLKMGDGDSGEGVYLSKSLKEALTWKSIFEIENEYKDRFVENWYVIEVINLDENKIDKGESFDMGDGEFYYTEWVYRDEIQKENIKSIYKV